MKKKILYLAAFAVVLVLGYLNYFREEPGIKEVKEVVETTNIAYETSGYFIEAEKQFDDLATNDTAFEKASAKFKDMILTGDNVLLNSARNLFLKNNIVGKSGQDWEFFADKLDYNQLKDLITTDAGIKAVNKTEDLLIKSLNFETNSKFDFVNLEKNIEIYNGDTELFGDIGRYTAGDKVMRLSKNGRFKTKDKEGKEISGIFDRGIYSTEKKILELFDKFTINYGGASLHGTKMWYNDLNKGFAVLDNPVIEVGGYKIYTKEIKNPDGDNIVDIVGEITGTDGETSFRGNTGYYDTLEKKLYVNGDIVVTSKAGERVDAEKMIYDTVTKNADFIGKNNKVVYTFNDRKAEATKFLYNSESKMVYLDEGYIYEDNIYKSKGKKLEYNSGTGDGVILFGNIITKDKQETAEGDKITFNSKKRDYVIEKNAVMNDGKYLFKSDRLDYLNSTGFAHLFEPFTITNLKDKSIVSGNRGGYNITTGDFTTDDVLVYESVKEKVSGKEFLYNMKTEKGKVGKDVVYKDKKDGTILTADTGVFQKDKFVELEKNLKIETAKELIFADKGRYNLVSDTINIPGKIDFNAKDGSMKGTVYDGVIDKKSDTFTGKKLDAVTDKNETISADSSVYYMSDSRLNLKGRVKLSDSSSVLSSEDMDYNTKTKKAVSNTPFKLVYDKSFVVTGHNGKADMMKETINGTDVKIVSDKKEEFSADKIDGNMNEMRFDFIGNAKGKAFDTDEKTGKTIPVNYTGDFVRVYFKKSQEGYKAVRLEGRENSVLTRDSQAVYSDYIETDIERGITYAGKNNKVVLNDENGRTVITGDILTGNSRTNIMEVRGNAFIENKDKEGKITTLKGEEAVLDNENSTIIMIENVVAENDEMILNADKAVYSKATNKVKAFGKVIVNYKVK